MNIVRHMLRRALILVATAGLLIGTAACESDDDEDSAPSVSPASVKLTPDQTGGIVFTVDGGKPDYTWMVANPLMGSIAAAGETAIYTRTALTGLNFVFVTDANNNTVTATINQL
ncbi:MAG: hypothetical protein K8T26_05465 [Lentisphaerae bacterium]|nr:hypothetical protein [Lentisphaerota bacterium]